MEGGHNSRDWKNAIEGGCELLGVILELIFTVVAEILTALF